MAPIATVMRQARAIPSTSELARTSPTIMATPQKAATLHTIVCHRAVSPSQIHASAAATKGPVAIMTATFDTLVSCSAGIKVTIPTVARAATSQPLLPILLKSCSPVRP